jgi:hypothetical protein
MFAAGLTVVSEREQKVWLSWMQGVMNTLHGAKGVALAPDCSELSDCSLHGDCSMCAQWEHYSWPNEVAPKCHLPTVEWLFGAGADRANHNNGGASICGVNVWGPFKVIEPAEGDEAAEAGRRRLEFCAATDEAAEERRRLGVQHRHPHRHSHQGHHQRRLLAYEAAQAVLKSLIPGATDDAIMDLLSEYDYDIINIKNADPVDFANKLAQALGVPPGQVAIAGKILALLNGDFSALSLTGSGALCPQQWEFFSIAKTVSRHQV